MLRRLRRAFARRFICPARGHRYDTPDFAVNCLYFCARCGKEMFDRTIDDLRAMPPMSDEQMEAHLRSLNWPPLHQPAGDAMPRQGQYPGLI